MLAIAFASIVFGLVFIVEIVKQFKTDKKVFWLNVILLGVTYTGWVLYGLGVQIPGPSEPIEAFVKWVFQLKN